MASPLTIQPSSKDNTVYGGDTTANYGTSAQISIYSYSFGNRNERGIVTFPITWGTDIPNGATLTSATFSMYRTGGSARTHQVYKCTRDDWGETTSSWQRYKTNTNWTNAGGDYVTSNPTGASMSVPTGAGWSDWNVLAIAQDAQTNSINFNFLVKDANENNATNTGVGYRSREDSTTAQRPKLVIEYTAATTYDETGKVQVVLAASGKTEQLINAEPAHAQIVLVIGGTTDVLLLFASFAGQTIRTTTGEILASCDAQLLRTVVKASACTAQAVRAVRAAAGYTAQTRRASAALAAFIGQTRRIAASPPVRIAENIVTGLKITISRQGNTGSIEDKRKGTSIDRR